MKKELKDSIDFEREDVGKLFRRLFHPTLIGMLSTVLFIITDGVFVGKGLGSDALAAVNIVAPIYMLATGIGLMTGMGASVVASIHIANRKIKVACLNITQAIGLSTVLLLLLSVITLVFPTDTLKLFGCSDELMSSALEYAYFYLPFLFAHALLCGGQFFIRLDGSPRYAMFCSISAAVLNIILDYLYIFPLKWGLMGAALASSTGAGVGAILVLLYLKNKRHTLHIVPIKSSLNSIRLTFRNIRYICQLGFSSLLCQMTVAFMMICGNLVFMRHAYEEGVAAFSIACYLFPIVFMLYNSITQSSQPIISYNYSIGNNSRVRAALIVALKTALGYSFGLTLCLIFLNESIVHLFISPNDTAYSIATQGIPLFAFGFLPFAINVLAIGYFQSIERVRFAILITVLRGFVWMTVCFLCFPYYWGVTGAWLSVPFAELFTLMTIAVIWNRLR